MERILSIYEDDPDMLEIVREFVAELPNRVAALESHLANGDMPELQTLAHQLKGAGGGYGFPQITEVAAVLEQAVKEGVETSVVKERLASLCDTLRAAGVSEAN